MSQSRTSAAARQATIDRLIERPLLQSLGPIGARFVYSLRLIAVHQRVKRDPVPELANRLNSVNVAAKTLALSQMVSSLWPEDIHVSRYCCPKASFDEATIAQMINACAQRDRAAFDAALDGLFRRDRLPRLWDAVADLVEAELRAI